MWSIYILNDDKEEIFVDFSYDRAEAILLSLKCVKDYGYPAFIRLESW